MGVKKCWLRILEVTLSSETLGKSKVFGNNWEKGETDLNIQVNGTKYLSPLKDEAVVRITNLTYREIVELIDGKYYDIEIKCGYRPDNKFTIFKGGVLYISNELGDRKSNDVIILCANNLVAKYGQARMNVSMTSGINMYSAIKFITEKAGIKNAFIDESFKNRILQETEVQDRTITSWLDMVSSNEGFVINADYSSGSEVSLWDPYNTDLKVIKFNDDNIILTGGYPTLDSQGLKVAVMPTINLVPGYTIIIDNSIIDIGTENRDEAFKNVGQFLDPDKMYVIMQLDFSLSNRDSDFSFKMKCRAKYLWSRFIGK